MWSYSIKKAESVVAVAVAVVGDGEMDFVEDPSRYNWDDDCVK